MAIGELRYKGILFGDDYWGSVIHEQAPYKNQYGIEMKRYLIIPSDDLVAAYPERLTPDKINVRTPRGMAVWVEYPTDLVTDENPSRTNAIVRIDCGFDGRETPLTRKHRKLLNELRELRLENEHVRISNMVLMEEKGELMDEQLVLAKKWAEINQVMKSEHRTEESSSESSQE